MQNEYSVRVKRSFLITVAIAVAWLIAAPGSGFSQTQVVPPSSPQTAVISPQCAWISHEHPDLEPLARVCENAHAMRRTLPNFICDQETKCTYPVPQLSQTQIVFREAVTVVTAQVTYQDGEERFDNIIIDRHAANSIPANFGMWSEGEFSPLVLSVLNPRTQPELKLRQDESGAAAAYLFDYRIRKETNAGWSWRLNNREVVPGYHGTILVDKASGQLVRITRIAEASAHEIDSSVPYTFVGSEVDYSEARIAELGKFFLPVKSQLVSCERGVKICHRNVLTFKNCRKFAAKSRIITDAP